MNSYLIISSDKINIDSNIQEILKEIKDDYDLIKYNGENDLLESAVEELDIPNLFSNKKVVIFNGFENIDKDSDISILIKYLENPSENHLILVGDSVKKSVLSKISNNLNIIEKELTSADLIKKNLTGYKMDSDTIAYFVDYCLGNNEKLLNELKKLQILKVDDKDKTITIDDIKENVIRDFEDDPFLLPNAISKKDKQKAIEIFNRLSSKEKEPVKILGTISHQIRTLYIAKVLSKTMSVQEISEFTGQKNYPITLAINNSQNFTEKELLDMLEALSDIDIKSKSEYGNMDLLFELFIIGL